ncbi:hypothetical protein P171DRAFT_432058 [Karstenula rhodostoma CBS 690.94]|uniref:Secreted protein n=1 Tax=Karstenula rhodostoma CBS 690.94 TaxID=1392251 RepID=A0A9P4PJF1_9PLEO|nr:hypothetical protein P171DRAFT_432058 [Karstenula rhodostoma CBS 690.94]
MKSTTAIIALFMGAPIFAAPILQPSPTTSSSGAKPTAFMPVNYDASYAPKEYKWSLPPPPHSESDLAKRDCSSFNAADRAWIAAHPELASVLEHCESGELYAPPTPTEDHVGACNEWSIGC